MIENILETIPKDKVYYLASPYSHDNPFIKSIRYQMINYAGAVLTKHGYILLEPIASCHDKSLNYDLPGGYDFWQFRDRTMIERSDGVIVFKMPGWTKSKGVTDEIQYAESIGKPVHYIALEHIITSDIRDDIFGDITPFEF